MRSALLLIDLQKDFLQRQGLSPRSDRLVAQVEYLLKEFRQLGGLVFHVWTQVSQDGRNRMPHWKRNNTWACVEGTPGVLPPEVLRPRGDEPVFTKQYFSAFRNPSLDSTLRAFGIDTVILAGIFLHGCIRSTALDAYEHGYNVWIVDDAVGSDEPDHAEISRTYLAARAATFIDTHVMLSQLDPKIRPRCHPPGAGSCPVASIGGKWINANGHPRLDRRNPSNWKEIHASVPLASAREVNEACLQAANVHRMWRDVSSKDRGILLNTWADILSSRENDLATLLAKEIGKPLINGYDEVRTAVSFIRATAGLCLTPQTQLIDQEEQVVVRYRPHGVIGVITPWNNPIGIPVGKISPALAYGNTVVWKPAVEAPQTAMAVLDALYEADGMAGLVNLVFGAERTVREIIEHSAVGAVTFTGSTESGKSIAALCTRYTKPLQAELGGNNAAIICGDCDVRAEIQGIALSAFGFSGQRCTSIQRIIVERSIFHEFRVEFVKAVEALTMGNPEDPETIVGPLISQSHQQRIISLLNQATMSGAKVYCGGMTPQEFQHGCWLSPTVLGQVDLDSPLSQDEVFGPVAVIHEVENLDEAISINNRVKFGLVAGLYNQDKSQRHRFLSAIEAGILKMNQGPFVVHPLAPFGGWKASGIGLPEHGIGDREFYARPQTIYGLDYKNELREHQGC